MDDQKLAVTTPSDPWSDDRARDIVNGDILLASADKLKNVDPKIQQGDELYLSNPKKRNWDNTKIPRASVNIHLVYEQANAIIPHIISALFSDPNHIDVAPRFGTTITQASNVKHLLQWQLEDLTEDGYVSLREAILRMVTDAVVYMNGVIEFGWLEKQIEKCIYERTQKPALTVVNGVMVQTGAEDVVTKKEEMVDISRPFVRNVNLRNFFIDPNCKSHNVADAAYCYTVDYMSIDELDAYRNIEDFNIPDGELLKKWAGAKGGQGGDNDTQFQDSLRDMASNPQVDQSKDPNKSRVLVYRYWQNERHVWLIKSSEGDKSNHVAYNQKNRYGVKPFLNFCYSPLAGRFWGMGIAELLRSDQTVIEDLVNNRLDEENLWMHRPLIKKRGVAMPQSAFRIAPGRVWEGAKDDYTLLDTGSPNPIVFEEVNQVYQRVEKKTGASSLSVLGTASSGGNSAARTATGVATQSAATSIRLMHLVENIEDRVLVPLYSSLLSLDQKFLDPQKMITIMGETEPVEIDPVDIFNASVKFRFKASTKMRAKFAIQQNIVMLAEMGLNPTLLELLAQQQGMTADMRQWMELFCEGLDVPFRALYRPISDEEKQAMNQPTADQTLRSQMQTQRLEQQSESQVAKEDAALTGKVVDKILSNPQVQEELTGLKAPKEKPNARTGRKASAGRS